MKYIQRIIGSVSICFMATFVFAQGNGKKVQAVFDGEIRKPVHAALISGDEYLSVHDIAQAYGSRIVYHPVTGKVSLSMNNCKLDIYIKSTKVTLDGKKKSLNKPSKLIAGELYIPAAFLRSSDFSKFTECISQFNQDSEILTIEQKTNINPPRYYSKPGSTQIVIEMNEALSCEFKDKSPATLTLSFIKGRLNEENIDVDDGVIKGFQTKNTGRQAQVVITLEPGAGAVENKYYEASKKYVITVSKAPRSAKSGDIKHPEKVTVSSGAFVEAGVFASTNTTAVHQASGSVISSLLTLSTAAIKTDTVAAQPSKNKKLIILDAGHGGDDPGAIGPNGTKEKDINLAIVYELKKLFEEDGEYNVLLTRTDDTFVPLVDRTEFANKKRADMFIAVHCNANMDRNTKGFEIYFLSENASDSDAAATAVLENSVVRLEGKPSKQRAKIQELLWSMTVNEFINDSAELCSMIAGEVPRRVKIDNKGVKQAGFFVLRGASMPAVLVECAFLSNYGEEAKLRTKRVQANMADSIFEGVKKYYQRKEIVNAKR